MKEIIKAILRTLFAIINSVTDFFHLPRFVPTMNDFVYEEMKKNE